ncbi:LOW QUALITY PROTEIN: hypothetical protein YC2023_008294 [Brassica napus]
MADNSEVKVGISGHCHTWSILKLWTKFRRGGHHRSIDSSSSSSQLRETSEETSEYRFFFFFFAIQNPLCPPRKTPPYGATRSDSIEYRRENLCQSCCLCSKTALQMADSRLKILKNKNEIQIKQLRRELAQLLEAGNSFTNGRFTPILKNKKEIQIKQLSRELAQLLEAGNSFTNGEFTPEDPQEQKRDSD